MNSELFDLAVRRARIARDVPHQQVQMHRPIDEVENHIRRLEVQIAALEARIAALEPIPIVVQQNIKGRNIIDVVCAVFCVPYMDLMSKRRFNEIVIPRMVTSYLMRKYTRLSLPQIAKQLGQFDHSTILHHIRRITELRGQNEELNEKIKQCERRLKPSGEQQ